MIKIILNPKEFFREARRLESSINVEKIVDAAAAGQLNRVRTRFLNQEDTQGGRWPESHAAARRRASGRGGGTLFDTGTLFHSIGIERIGPGERSIGTNVPYAKEHQDGLLGNPKREFLGFSAEDDKDILKTSSLLLRRLISR